MIDYSTGRMIRPGSKYKNQNFVESYDELRGRKWEYQSPKSSINSIIFEKHLRHFPIKKSKERQQFSKKKLYQQPNTQRTLLSNLLPEEKFRKIQIKKRPEPKREHSIHLKRGPDYIYKDHFSFDNSRIKNNTVREKKSNNLYNEYNNKSQIIFLPGGIKRKEETINDDYKPIKNKQKLVEELLNKYNSDSFWNNPSIRRIDNTNIRRIGEVKNNKNFNQINDNKNILNNIKSPRIKRRIKL